MLTEKFKKLREKYYERYEFWRKNLPDGPMKEIIVKKSHDPAVAFYEKFEKEFLPAVFSNDKNRANAVENELGKLYGIHRTAIDELVRLAGKSNSADEALASSIIRRGKILLIAIACTIMAAIAVAFLGIRQMLANNVLRLVSVTERFSSGDLSARSGLQGKDEISEIGRAFDGMAQKIEDDSAALKESVVRAESEKAKSEAIIAAIGDGISIQDADFRVLYQNVASEKMVGKHAGEFCYKGYRGKESVCVECAVDKVFRDGKIHMVETTIRQGEKTFYLEITASPLRDPTGRIVAGIEVVRDVTERRRSEMALRESEQKFRAIFDQTFQFIGLMTTDGVITEANRTALEFAGLSESDVLNKPFWETHWWTHSKELQGQLRLAVKKSAQGEFVRFEATHPAADGSLHHVDFSIKPVLNDAGEVVLLIAEGRDITDRKKAVERLRKEAERGNVLLELYEKAPRLTDKQLYEYALDHAVSLTGSAIGFFHLVTDDQKSVILTTWNNEALKNCKALYAIHYSIDEAGNWVDCVRLKQPVIYNDFENSPNRKGLPEGHTPVNRFMSIPVVEDDKVRIIFGVGNKVEEYDEYDVVHIRLVANELHKIINQRHGEETLRGVREEMVRKEKLAVLGQLAGIVGHEIRNPLGVMNNAVYFLKTAMSDADDVVKEYLGIIKQEIDNSQRIISDLLGFARTKPPQARPVMVRGLVSESLGKCRVPDNIEVRTDIPDILPQVNVDPFQIGQVLQNLIANAVQAMPEGGALDIGARLVQGSALQGADSNIEPETDWIEISVRDAGEGISPENMGKLFQPLFTTKTKGIGLGLVVCRNLTEANGGRIAVESEFRKGTTFRVLLPLCIGTQTTSSV
ncbi:MAG: PAS domain S-box protein [Eubacteriales bacterium]|nr:PAS domain S-box protein [Eubacteriales bacterium]